MNHEWWPFSDLTSRVRLVTAPAAAVAPDVQSDKTQKPAVTLAPQVVKPSKCLKRRRGELEWAPIAFFTKTQASLPCVALTLWIILLLSPFIISYV